MRDSNDILVPYQLDIEGIARFLYEHVRGSDADFASFLESAYSAWYLFSIVAYTLSILFLVVFVYAVLRHAELVEHEKAMIREAEHAYRHAHLGSDEHPKWRQVTEHVNSDSPNDWRLAIIEADIMLDELLAEVGYRGATIGEKLKTARPEIFETLQDAWDAHKIRNEVAHRGSDYVLTKRTAQEAIAKYERVFREFQYL